MGHREPVAEVVLPRTSTELPQALPAAAGQARPVIRHAPATVATRRPSLRRYGWLALLALAGGVGAAGWHFASAEAPPHYVTANAEIATIEDIVSATGTVQPLEYVDVGTQVTGQLRALHVAIGSAVKKGELVAEIDPTVFEARVETTRAQLRTLEAQLREREAQAQLAELLRDRNRRLRAADAVSVELLQQSEAAAVQARAQVDMVRAQIQQTQSSMIADEANLRYTRIYAPIDGTVVSLNARQGQTLVSNQQATVIMRIADLSTMTVWAQVSEADVPQVAVDMPVYFNTLGLPDRRWTGRVRQVLPTPETVNNVVLYNVVFDVPNPDGALKPQMSTQVSFRVASAEHVVTIPPSALQTAVKSAKKDRKEKKKEAREAREGAPAPALAEKDYMVRVLHDGKVEERLVRVGLQTRMQAQVKTGLKAGEEVILDTPAGKARGKKAERAD
jgi:macrolide-specific efflux system membrane fusion protein